MFGTGKILIYGVARPGQKPKNMFKNLWPSIFKNLWVSMWKFGTTTGVQRPEKAEEGYKQKNLHNSSPKPFQKVLVHSV